MNSNFYIAEYFKKTRKILKEENSNNLVTMQFFQRHNNVVLCGIKEVLDLLKNSCTDFEELEVYALKDGDHINENEPVLKITGKYEKFGFLEGMIDGILSRNSSVATNAYKVVSIVGVDKIISMQDRADHYTTLPYDGYASYIGGIRKFVTEASISLIPNKEQYKTIGTMPHALIQSFNGDIIKAADAFNKIYPNEKLVVLVDYNNDCIKDSLKVAKHFKEKLYAVRVDTSISLIDKFFDTKQKEIYKNYELKGVSIPLIKELRKNLDSEGYDYVKIIVSSGFNDKKIELFEQNKVPVDIYGVGEFLSKIDIHFTGDLVLLNGKKQSKFGRNNIESERLIKIN